MKASSLPLFCLIALAAAGWLLDCPASAGDQSAGAAEGRERDARVNRPVKDKWALVIGISRFKKAEINLKYPAKDARDFADFLISDGKFAADHVALLTDEAATRGNILSVLGDRWLPRVANPDDLVLIFISSHGSPSAVDVGGVNYLIAHDTDPENLFATGIPMQDLARVIKLRVHSDRVVVFLDACHSGAVAPASKGLSRHGNIDADEIAQGTGQLIISSSLPDQRSWEAEDVQNGVFTKHLIAALKREGGRSPLGSAFEFLREKVQEQVLRERGELQTPVLRSVWQGRELVLAAVPSAPRPGLPVSLPEPAVPGGQAAAGQRPLAPAAAERASQPEADAVPRVWHSLEKNPWGTLLGTWIYNDESKEFQATYNTGGTATLVLEEFGKDRVRLSGRFSRSITAPGKGQKYTFAGTRAGRKVYGTVTYDHLGFKVKGKWEAWFD